MGGSRVVSQGLTLSVLRLLEAWAVCSWSSSSSSFGGGSFHICSTTQEIHTKYYYLCTSERSCSRAYGQRPVSGRPHRSCSVTKQPLHLGLCGSGIWTGYSVNSVSVPLTSGAWPGVTWGLALLTRAPACGLSVWLGFLIVRWTQGSWPSYTVAQGSKCQCLSEKADTPFYIPAPLPPPSPHWSNHKSI